MHSGNISRQPLRLERTLPWACAALVVVFAAFELSNFDLRVQDMLFNFAHGCWRVNGNEPVGRALFYTGPKALLIGFGVAGLMLGIAPPRWRAQLGVGAVPLGGIWVFVLTLATAPALVGLSKTGTNVFCPSEIRRYGGGVPYVKVLESLAPESKPARKGRGFPAGHASGGFALMALAGVARTRRGQLTSVAAGLAMGGAMGGYQMAKGAHYLSHTVITALLAWIVFVSWLRLLRCRGRLVLNNPGRSNPATESATFVVSPLPDKIAQRQTWSTTDATDENNKLPVQ